jgi:hypothetical protein
MNAPKLHLNLLRDSERQSSSPVRLRVMLPILAALACVGCLVWWGVLAGQLILAKAKVSSLLGGKTARYFVYDADQGFLRTLFSPSFLGAVVHEALPDAGLSAAGGLRAE